VSDDPKKPGLDPRSVILARRARFVAAAMASIGIACGKEEKKPEPCLSVVAIDASIEPNALADAAPSREAGVDGLDASADAASPPDAGSVDAGPPPKRDAGPAPRPCLSVTPRPCLSVTPAPCLKVAPPKDPKDPL
jgi:hypothetical protein